MRLFLIALVLAGFGLAQPLVGTRWSLEQSGLQQPPTLTLYGGQAYGYTGCNRFNTTYRLRGGQIAFGVLRLTGMTCNQAQGKAEVNFLAVLRGVPNYRLQGGKLVLQAKAGTLSFAGPVALLASAPPKPAAVVKSVEPKPTTKPEPKPVEVKPVEVKPVEVKPVAPPKPPAAAVKALQVGPNTVGCTTTDITQCLLVRENETQPWALLAEPIEGFEFAEGYQHGVRVEISPDGSKYKLLRVLGQKPSATRVRVWEVSPERAECQGMVAQQCVQVRSNQDEFWQNLADPIEGFSPQEGRGYTVLVEIAPVENPPADAPSLKYRLLRVIESR